MVSRSISAGSMGKLGASLLRVGSALLLLGGGTGAWGQANRLDSVPTGLQPLGIDIAASAEPVTNGGSVYAAVANSGSNSVSVLRLGIDPQNTSGPKTITPLTTVTGIPSPYAVSSCPVMDFTSLVLVTSPSDNSVRLVDVIQGVVTHVIRVGSQPYSVSPCFVGPNGDLSAVVSNLGDSSLSVLDLNTQTVLATIPGVPGSRGFHGIAVSGTPQTSIVAWIAGTDANVVTVVDLVDLKVLTQISVQRPTAVRSSGNGSSATMSVASAGSNSIIFYDRDTAQVTGAIQNVPNPQDFVFPEIGTFATIGGQDSLWSLDETGTITTPSIPGAAALSATSFGFAPSAPTWVALVTSTASNSVFLIQPQLSSPHDFRLSNGASFGTTQAAAGQLASLFATTGVSQNFNASMIPLLPALGGVTISIGGTLSFDATAGWTYSSTGAMDAPLVFVGPSQVNFQVPPGIAPGDAVPVQLTKADGSTLLSTVNITATAPGIFSVLMNGQGQGAVLNQDNSQNGIPQVIMGAAAAPRGSVIQIFATGGGETTPVLASGDAAPVSGNPLVQTNATPTVFIGGIQANLKFSGMAPGWVGLWQINAEVPATVTPGSAVPLSVNIGGVQSNTVTIAVQ